MGRAGLTVVVLQSGDDLVRARADRATACFVLTNRFTMDTDEMDSITVLRALNVKSFNQDLQTFVQIIGASPVLGYTSRCPGGLCSHAAARRWCWHGQSRKTQCMWCRLG